jgi:hypothetical protein
LWWFNNGENWPDSVAFACSAALVSESSRLNRELHLCLQQTGDRWGDHDRLMDYGYQKLFTPDFRSVLNVPLAPMSDFDLVTVSDQMALFAYVEGTGVSIRGRGFSPVTVVALGQTNSILDLPAASSLAGPRREIDIDVMFPAQGLSPGAGSMVDLVTARRVGSNLHLEAWKISADPGF